MRSDDKDDRGVRVGGGSGRPMVLDRPPGTGDDGMIDVRELRAVRLVCLFCKVVRLIHVPVECDTPREIVWECLTCQERAAAHE